jgi:hypothetical protein
MDARGWCRLAPHFNNETKYTIMPEDLKLHAKGRPVAQDPGTGLFLTGRRRRRPMVNAMNGKPWHHEDNAGLMPDPNASTRGNARVLCVDPVAGARSLAKIEAAKKRRSASVKTGDREEKRAAHRAALEVAEKAKKLLEEAEEAMVEDGDGKAGENLTPSTEPQGDDEGAPVVESESTDDESELPEIPDHETLNKMRKPELVETALKLVEGDAGDFIEAFKGMTKAEIIEWIES